MKRLIPLVLSAWLLAINPALAKVLTSQTITQADQAIAQAGRTYIGLRYRDLPRGLISLGGWLLPPRGRQSMEFLLCSEAIKECSG